MEDDGGDDYKDGAGDVRDVESYDDEYSQGTFETFLYILFVVVARLPSMR